MVRRPAFLALALWLAVTGSTLLAATITTNNVTAVLGPDFFFDDAATGGNDNSATVFVRDISGYWASNATVSLKGLGWASKAGGTAANRATATFTDPGSDGVYGTADDVIVGTRTDNLVPYTVVGSEYAWQFDSNVVFTAQSGALRISIAGYSNGTPAVIYRKTTSGSTQDAVKLSLAGTAVGGTAVTFPAIASASGNWDQITWNLPSGTATGSVPNTNAAVIGSERVVTYRGIPAQQTIAGLDLGDSSSALGRGTLIISNGTIHVTGSVNSGRNADINDGFLKINGGTLQVDGSMILGQSVDGADGWVEIGGGTVSIGGDMKAGAFLSGGALLRFQNPGSAAPVQIGGRLDLGRATLGLTFTTNYVHTPGATIPLLEYASRTGQFINCRNGDEFNFSSNRFRINYDVTAAGGRRQITITALTNWPAAVAAPNIIFILADDQGYADLRVHGDGKYPMPELEKLAAAGARFTDAYVCGGVCHPSRSAILTGRYQQRIGTDNNLAGPSYNGTSAAERTVPQRLQGLGYRTYSIGKWHMGNTAEYLPNQRGYDRWYGINAGSRSYYTASGEDNLFQNDMQLRPQDEGLYVADRIGNACVAFIDEHLTNSPGLPFFIYCAFTSVHAPMDISPSDARFARLQTEFGLTYGDYAPSIVFSGSTAATTQQNRYELAAMTLALDENVGKIMNKVNSAGLSTNTIIIYFNDNGGAGWSASFGGNFSYNTPLRGYKGGSMTEGSIRVPAAIQWPGKIPGGQVITNPVNSLDFMASAVNASGNAVAAARNGLEGLDILPLLRTGTALPKDRVMFWRSGDISSGGSAARMGDWKILADNTTGVFQLYNLVADIDENADVSGANPAVFAELKERFAAWNSANIEPFYGSSDVSVDATLERSGIRSGYRICNRTASPASLTASLRKPISMSTNFSLGFYLRAVETNHAGGEQLWFALGDTTNRASLIRAGVDFGSRQLRLIEGKTGGSASVPLETLPNGFVAGTLQFAPTGRQLTFALGGTNVSLTLGGSYGVLDTYGCGAAAMEGEVMQPFQPALPAAAVQTFNVQPSAGRFCFDARFAGDSVFGPKLERAPTANGPYQMDEQGLIESLGGGLYRITTPMTPGITNEFFRVTFNQP